MIFFHPCSCNRKEEANEEKNARTRGGIRRSLSNPGPICCSLLLKGRNEEERVTRNERNGIEKLHHGKRMKEKRRIMMKFDENGQT